MLITFARRLFGFFGRDELGAITPELLEALIADHVVPGREALLQLVGFLLAFFDVAGELAMAFGHGFEFVLEVPVQR